MQTWGVEGWDGDVRRLDDQRKFRATENDSLCALLTHILDLIQHTLFALRFKNAQAQLLVNDAMQFAPDGRRLWHHGLDPVMLLQPLDQERVFHGVLGSDQTHLLQALLLDGPAGGVSDVEDWNVYARRYRVIDFVGRVGAEHDALRAGGLQTLACVHEDRSNLLPSVAVLKLVDVLLIQVENNQRWIRVVVVRIVYGLVDVAVVIQGRISGGTTDEAKSLHACGRRQVVGLAGYACIEDDCKRQQQNKFFHHPQRETKSALSR